LGGGCLELKINARVIISAIYGLFGLIQLIVFGLSGLRMIYMGALGALSIISSVGFVLRWPILWLTITTTLLTLTMGISTLYSSFGFIGFKLELGSLLFNLGLVAYTMIALFLLFYLIGRRKTFSGKVKG
jgi:hypothetical protein